MRSKRGNFKLGPPDSGTVIAAVIRFAARAAGWAAVLFLMGLAAPYTGVDLSLNAYSVAACGLLGMPGLGVLLCAGAIFR